MADIAITAANVVSGVGGQKDFGTAGATITAGQTVYLDATTQKYLLSDADGTGTRQSNGIALNGAANNQPLSVHRSGPITIGGTLVPGAAYYVSSTAGGIAPAADNTTGKNVILLGLATSTTVLNVDIQNSGVTVA